MPAKLEQTASNSVIKYNSYTTKVTFDEPTRPGNLIVVACVAAGGLPVWEMPPMPGFQLLKTSGLRDIQLTVWYKENAPSMESITVNVWGQTYRSLQVRAMEYSGVAQLNALDKLVSFSAESRLIRAPSTGNISQADELVLAFVANQYASTAQLGFSGGLVRLFESLSPREANRRTNEDWERSRLTVHQAITTVIQAFTFLALLTTTRRWICFVVTFKGGTTGPKKLSSTQNLRPCLIQTGRGQLSAFGPMRSTQNLRPLSSNPREGSSAVMFPFAYQYRLGNGMLIGSGTPYKVYGTEGLNGFTVSTSDADIPRGDGAIRGIDLSSPRQWTMTINVGRNAEEIELLLDRLYFALAPQRDEDWELVWRHPTQSARMIRVRPIELPRVRNNITNRSYSTQTIGFRSADPRHYSAAIKRVNIANTPSGVLTPVETNVYNSGNIDAYPVITIKGPKTGPPVTSIQLNNKSTLRSLNLEVLLPNGSELIADMDARVTGAPRSVVTLDGQSRYGSWQLPRDPFAISADPTGLGGYNVLTLETVPVGAPITCTLEYRDTWSG